MFLFSTYCENENKTKRCTNFLRHPSTNKKIIIFVPVSQKHVFTECKMATIEISKITRNTENFNWVTFINSIFKDGGQLFNDITLLLSHMIPT